MTKYLLEILIEPIGLDKTLDWLNKYEAEYFKAIAISYCRQWSKWERDKSIHILPCCCHTKEANCIFIETYWKLKRTINTIKSEEFYKSILQLYYPIKNNQKAVFEWVKAHEEVGDKLLLIESIIKIATHNEPYKTIDIHLNQKENPNLWEFKGIFTTNYYSKEYENY